LLVGGSCNEISASYSGTNKDPGQNSWDRFFRRNMTTVRRSQVCPEGLTINKNEEHDQSLNRMTGKLDWNFMNGL
jgi:hypothetical protein